MEKARALWVIYLSLLFAALCQLVPLTMEWRVLRPTVIDLVLIYWILALPHRVGVATAFCVGVLLDGLEGSPLGLSSPGLMLSSLVVLFNYQRIRQFDGLQQMVVVFLLLALSLGIEQWLRTGVDIPTLPLGVLSGLLMSALLWLPVRNGLRRLRRYYEVY